MDYSVEEIIEMINKQIKTNKEHVEIMADGQDDFYDGANTALYELACSLVDDESVIESII